MGEAEVRSKGTKIIIMFKCACARDGRLEQIGPTAGRGEPSICLSIPTSALTPAGSPGSAGVMLSGLVEVRA